MLQKILITPFHRFNQIQSFSGIILFAATIFALVWANSPYGHIYESLWQYKFGFGTEDVHLNKPLILWINDGLMAIFFFVIGLEIKRELLIGELNSIKKAAFPFLAAIGGMIVPLAIFMLLNKNPETAGGWGIPMATDIAFTLAILKLLGNRVPLSLKIFLTAFAIVDDIGAVLVIALFYSSNINWIMLLYAAIPLLILFYLAYKDIYIKYIVFVFGFFIWFCFLKSGIHPTVAGVLVAFTIPIRQRVDIHTFTDKLQEIVDDIKSAKNLKAPILSKEQIEEIDNLEEWTGKIQSPLQHLEHRLHNWVAYVIMPIFALANAGVVFSNDMQLDTPLILNLVVGLIIGKCIGITLMSWLSVKLKLAVLPFDMNWTQIIGVSILAGLGFTMSIFIANLAFTNNTEYIDSAKVGILIASLLAGLIGYIILRFAKNPNLIDEELEV